MSDLKGSADPVRRSGHELRSVLGGPNHMLSCIHVPDEPADVLREIGIFFDRPERVHLFKQMLAQADHDATAEVEQVAQAMYQTYGSVDLDANSALERLTSRLTERPAQVEVPVAAVERLRRIVEDIAQGHSLDWREFLDNLLDARIEVPLWDAILMGSQFIQYSQAVDRYRP